MERIPEADEIEAIVRTLSDGGVACIPTETFYGLAVDALDGAAVRALHAVKGREAAKPVPVLLPDLSWIDHVSADVSDRVRSLAEAFWPGPLTIVVPAAPALPRVLCPDGTIGVRVTPHAAAQRLLQAFGGPVTATSANPAGLPPAGTAEDARRYFPLLPVLDAGTTPGGAPSTVVDVSTDTPRIIRAGAIPSDRVLGFWREHAWPG